MEINRNTTFKSYKKEALKAAKDLRYSEEIVEKIDRSNSEEEIATIMFVAMKNIGE